MLKKIISAILLTGFIGILIWGGVNRTLAKTDPSEGRNANNQSLANTEGNGEQQRGNREQETHLDDDCQEEGHEYSLIDNPGGEGNRNSAQNDRTNEALASASADALTVEVAGNNYGANDENQGQTQGNGNRDGRGNGNGKGVGNEPLTATENEALHLALDDEYYALAVYQAIIASFGQVEPFVEIAASEQRHIEALINQFNKHGLEIPENPWLGNVPPVESLQQACRAGVDAETANADLYDQLFSMTDDPGLTRVFTNLRNASLNSHLPEFQACQ